MMRVRTGELAVRELGVGRVEPQARQALALVQRVGVAQRPAGAAHQQLAERGDRRQVSLRQRLALQGPSQSSIAVAQPARCGHV